VIRTLAMCGGSPGVQWPQVAAKAMSASGSA
jgi:hypothetical protein